MCSRIQNIIILVVWMGVTGASGLAGLDLRRMLGLHAFTRRTTEQAVRFFLCVRGGGASGRTGVGVGVKWTLT